MTSLSVFLNNSERRGARLPSTYQKYLTPTEDNNGDDTESTADLTTETADNDNNDGGCSSDESNMDLSSIVRRASLHESSHRQRDSMDASVPWYSTFQPNDAFTPQENAILLKLSQELNLLQQHDVVSIWEGSTIATVESKRRVSQTIQRLSLQLQQQEIQQALQEEEEEKDDDDDDDDDEVTPAEVSASSNNCAVTNFVDTHLQVISPQFQQFSQNVDSWQATAEAWCQCLGNSLDGLFFGKREVI